MVNFCIPKNLFVLVGLPILLMSCAPLQQRFPILSLLSSPPRPPELAVRAEGLPALPQYRAVTRCRYSGRMSDGVRTQTDDQTITVRAVRDRLLVTSVVAGDESTLLISRTGHRYDFNAAATGGRFTPESGGSKDMGQSGMNNMDLYFPAFVSGPVRPGQIVSSMRDGGGVIQAAMVYRGLVNYRDRDALLLDLVRSSGNSDVGQTIGYSIVDRDGALPLLLEAAGNPSIRVEQIECQD